MFNVAHSNFGFKFSVDGSHQITIGDFDTKTEVNKFADELAGIPAFAKLLAKYGGDSKRARHYIRTRVDPALDLIEICTTPGKGMYLVGGNGMWYAHREDPATSVGPYATTQEALEGLHNWQPPIPDQQSTN